MKRHNGIVTERAHTRTDKKKFDKNYESIFGKKEKITCLHCDLSSLQKIGSDFTCPHCNCTNELEHEDE